MPAQPAWLEDRLNRFVLAALIGGVFAPFALPQDGTPVLTVNGDVIKAVDYYRRMEYLPGVSRKVGNTVLNYPPGFLTLEVMVTERLVFQLAKQKGVMPTEAEVQTELATMLAENPTLYTDAALTGQTKADVEYQLKYNLAQFKLATLGITITDQEVDTFYARNPEIFSIPKKFKLSVIAVTDEASKSKIDAELAAKKPFAEVAKTYSEDVTRATGGQFGTVPLVALPVEARSAINATKIGETTAWIAVDKTNVQMKFLLEDVVPGEKLPLDAKTRRQIRRQLMLQKGAVKNDVARELAEMRAKAKIEIPNKVFADMFKKFLQEYDEKFTQPKTTPPPAP